MFTIILYLISLQFAINWIRSFIFIYQGNFIFFFKGTIKIHQCIIIDNLKYLCSCVQITAKSIEHLFIYQNGVTVVIKVFNVCCQITHTIFTKILLMICCHHCNRLDQSYVTKWISSDIFQVQPLAYNIFHTYLSNTYAVLLWHIQSIKSSLHY